MSSGDEDHLCHEAEVALKDGDLQKAADLCKSLLVSFPRSAKSYHLTSALFQATGNYRKAYDYSSVASTLDARVAQYHLQQGRMLYLLHDYAHALEAFKRAAELAGNRGENCLWVARCLVEQEQFDQAKTWLDRAESKDLDIRVDRALCDMQAGDIATAEALLAEVVIDCPDHTEAHYAMAILAIYLMEFPRADALLRKVLELDGRHTQAHFYLSLLLAESGNERGAVDRLLQALVIDPTHVASLLLLGSIFMKGGDAASGEKAFAHVLALAPDHLLAWYSLLELMHEHGRGKEAIHRLNEIIPSISDPIPLKHLRALFSGDVPPASPKEFITAFYGAFAEMFEPWVVAASRTPHVEEMIKYLRELPELKDKRHVSLLDLGSGTGIIARELADIVAIAVGVDISPHMLKLARRTKRYDVLYELDMVDYVLGSETLFDVVIAAGALRWMGNLQPFFHAVRGVMHKNTILAFILDKEHSTLAYSVANHGRYSHHLSYVCDIAATEGIELVQHKEFMQNESEDDKVVRHLFFFKKMAVH